MWFCLKFGFIILYVFPLYKTAIGGLNHLIFIHVIHNHIFFHVNIPKILPLLNVKLFKHPLQTAHRKAKLD